MTRKILTAAVALVLALPLAAGAQKRPLSLEEALAAGLESSPGLHASRAEARGRVGQRPGDRAPAACPRSSSAAATPG